MAGKSDIIISANLIEIRSKAKIIFILLCSFENTF